MGEGDQLHYMMRIACASHAASKTARSDKSHAHVFNRDHLISALLYHEYLAWCETSHTSGVVQAMLSVFAGNGRDS